MKELLAAAFILGCLTASKMCTGQQKFGVINTNEVFRRWQIQKSRFFTGIFSKSNHRRLHYFSKRIKCGV